MSNSEKKLPVRNLERIAEKRFASYELAAQARENTKKPEGSVKVKIFARANGAYDLVWYKKFAEPKKEAKVDTEVALHTNLEDKPVHGLKAKERRKQA